jgi:high-affinity iron transporter
MLIFTGILIGVVLVTMVGKTIHVMQAVGWLPITPILGVQVPFWLGTWFGVYPTWQGLLAQTCSAVFVIGSYSLAEYFQKARRTQRKSRVPINHISSEETG